MVVADGHTHPDDVVVTPYPTWNGGGNVEIDNSVDIWRYAVSPGGLTALIEPRVGDGARSLYLEGPWLCQRAGP